MDWKLKMERSELFEWVKETYGTAPDYPWNDWNAVLRHAESKNGMPLSWKYLFKNWG